MFLSDGDPSSLPELADPIERSAKEFLVDPANGNPLIQKRFDRGLAKPSVTRQESGEIVFVGNLRNALPILGTAGAEDLELMTFGLLFCHRVTRSLSIQSSAPVVHRPA